MIATIATLIVKELRTRALLNITNLSLLMSENTCLLELKHPFLANSKQSLETVRERESSSCHGV